MPSRALDLWLRGRSRALDEIEQAHRSVGGAGPGRRYATQQINHAYAVLLSAEFQGFCRDLHDDCAAHLVQSGAMASLRVAFEGALVWGRKLNTGNPNPGNIGSDFNRFDLRFRDEVRRADARHESRFERLEELNRWRNAIAPLDFDPRVLGSEPLRLERVRDWRSACEGLAISFDRVMRIHLHGLTGTSPW
jgi:hypothetical protein